MSEQTTGKGFRPSILSAFLKSILIISLSLFLRADIASSQSNIDLFGYFQVYFGQVHERFLYENQAFNFSNEYEKDRNAFLLQQLNLFLRKEITEDLTAWINLEIKNNYSSERFWGTLNLEEAWVKYYGSNSLVVKAGLLIPQFNNLNEVKNRMPYLPYILRPAVYESSISQLITIDDYFPHQANLQVYGVFPLQDANVEYAAYIGNSEAAFITSENTKSIQSGVDTTNHFLLGGRVGLKAKHFKVGVSATFDKDNQTTTGLGEVNRRRVGGDLSFNIYRFNVETEIIRVFHNENSPISLDKLFYYGTLGYDFTDQLFGYVTYNYIEDDFMPALDHGFKGISFGGGYRFNEDLVLKAQYYNFFADRRRLPPASDIPIPVDFEFKTEAINLGLSVSF